MEGAYPRPAGGARGDATSPLAPERSAESLLAAARATTTPPVAPAALVFERGEGPWLFDRDGRRWLDFLGATGVASLGHSHPRLVAALQDQVGRLLHAGTAFATAPRSLFQERLVATSFAARVFLCNSGAEANEAALKLVRRYQQAVAGQPKRRTVISAGAGFHGRTLGTLGATGQARLRDGFGPLPGGFVHVPFNDVEALTAAADDTLCAVLLEPVLGEGGVVPARREYLEAARRLTREHGAALVFDEVQCGVGRLGTLWAYERFGVVPDVATWAKGLGGGVPLAAMAASEPLAAGFDRGSHASTFGGNALACRAGLTVLEVLGEPGFLDGVGAVAAHLRGGLEGLCARHPALAGVRGLGLMLGLETAPGLAHRLVDAAREEGLLVNAAGRDVVRLLPPLVIEPHHAEEAVERLDRALARLAAAEAR